LGAANCEKKSAFFLTPLITKRPKTQYNKSSKAIEGEQKTKGEKGMKKNSPCYETPKKSIKQIEGKGKIN
jgi:hypothetical protein